MGVSLLFKFLFTGSQYLNYIYETNECYESGFHYFLKRDLTTFTYYNVTVKMRNDWKNKINTHVKDVLTDHRLSLCGYLKPLVNIKNNIFVILQYICTLF